MKNHPFCFLAALLLINGTCASGQTPIKHNDAEYASYPHWKTMMQDPKGNFNETRKAFYLYWMDREITQGSGYNLFKRWEYQWKGRVNPDGSYPEGDQVYKTFSEYVNTHPQDGKLKTGQQPWLELGPLSRSDINPYMGMGRVNAIAFHPTDTSTLYAGAPTGGFWISHDSGRSWSTSTDNLPILGVSAISVDPVNPDIILMGTGDRDHGWSPAGMGVFRSVDGGLIWEPYNSGMGNVTVGMFARAVNNPQVILAAANGAIYKTENNGEDWVRTSTNSENYTDIKFMPRNSTIAYATSPGGFYRSENAGDTWTLVPTSSGYVKGTRMVIGTTPANDSLVYLLSGNYNTDKFLGCFLSRDFGKTFTTQATAPNILGISLDGSDSYNQVDYDFCVHVDPANPLILFVGAIRIWRSVNGGKNWEYDWRAASVHVDHHAFALNPLNNRLYLGNDGGIYSTDNLGATWKNLSNDLGIGQIYKIGVSEMDPNKMMAGFQDNGTAGWNGTTWSSTIGGDGMECAIDPANSRYGFASLQDGSIYQVSQMGGMSTKVAGLNFNGITESSYFVCPFAISEFNSNTMVVGYKNIWIHKNFRNQTGILWTKISYDLPGGNIQSVEVVELSPVDSNLLFVSRLDGRIFRTDNLLDREVKWTQLPKVLPYDWYLPHMDIECHPYDPKTVYFINNNKVYRSGDKGLTLEDITGSLPEIPLSNIVYDKTSNEGLYVGSDAGVYYKDAGMTDWVLYGTGMPVSAKVTELEIAYDPVSRQNSRLFASTFGRGAWSIGLAETNQALPPVLLTANVVDQSVELNWNPPFYKLKVVNYKVYRNGNFLASTYNLTFTDTGIEKDSTFYYTVKAIYSGGVESGFSNEANATLLSPVILPYTQAFETGMGGWVGNYSTDGWKYGTSELLGITGGTGHFFGIGGSAVFTGLRLNDYLITPEIDLTAHRGKTVTLRFAYTLQKKISSEKFTVVYRTAPDSAWVSLKNLDLPDRTKWLWDTVSLDLPEKALKAKMQIGFYYNNPYPAPGAAVDDVELFINTSAVEVADNLNTIRVFPNPTSGEVSLEIKTETPGEVVLRVLSMTGRVLQERKFYCHSGVNTEILDLSTQPKGIYQLLLQTERTDGQRNRVIKIVVL